MYGTMYGMKRTTIYLPDDLKARLVAAARAEGRTEADIIRGALRDTLDRREPSRLTIPLFESRGRQTNLAERVDEALEGFGET